MLPAEFDNLDVGITLHDSETGAVLDVNEELEKLYGYSRAELRSMTVGEYTAPSTRFTQEKALDRIRAAAAGESQVFEWHVERSNGELLWVSVHLSETVLDGVSCVLAEVYDITDFKARERRLRLLSRVLRHNLRNEMTVLRGYAELLTEAIEEETLEEQAETIFEIATEVGELSDSIRQIEEIATPDATKRSPTNLRDVVVSVTGTVPDEYPETDLSVETSEDVWVVADRSIRYAITHAIENAIEHNDRESPTVSVTIDDDPEAGRGVVRIADNGPEIPNVEIDVLDENTDPNEVYHGSGVGLWVMKWCVDSLGGSLEFESNSPRGNVVSISLPRVDP
ncbi:PAS domain-containing sensor histidine kinase [Natrarchaeobius halalkaliphilus]|uniref:histidine kinase n=1 Tax=Natrarchaeobius halalkaliphilus TaxID=1679091 RepID=A0A3N6MV19_9EURY|nr:PAS domain-containing sensor histidine kinase [Natrarchaeobius halalkaliphilus]